MSESNLYKKLHDDSKQFVSQRVLYKLVGNLTEGEFPDEISLLRDLVTSVVNSDQFGLIAGRIWEFIPGEDSYILRYQYGNMKKIPDEYKIKVTQNSIFSEIAEKRTIVTYETDKILQENGIRLYSATGVGDLFKAAGGKYYRYALGFSADEFYRSFYDTLSIISGVATVAIKKLSSQSVEKKFRKDLQRAAEIQNNLFPPHQCTFGDYDIYGVCIPDSNVGGDYFDYLVNESDDDERLGVVVSDAASKGLPAAIQALFVSGALKMGTSFDTKLSRLIAKLNTIIWRTFVYERFVTLCYCELHLSVNRLVLYVNAGHCAPIHYRPNQDTFLHLEPTGGILGLKEYQKFSVENIRMHQGDVLVMYTDGITESMNSTGELFGEDRLQDLIRKYSGETAKNIALLIIEAVNKFTVNSHYNDDKTIVVIKRKMPEE